MHILDAAAGSLAQTIPIGDSFAGVVFSLDGRKLYVGGGSTNEVKVLADVDGTGFVEQSAFKIDGSAPSGLCLSPDGSTLYAALNLKHSLAVMA